MKEFMGTPYPWRWFTSNSHNRLSSEVTGKDGDVIHADRASDGMVCVNVSHRDMPVIAAAPELLEQLQKVVGYCEAPEWRGSMTARQMANFMDGIRAECLPLIDKALGEKS